MTNYLYEKLITEIDHDTPCVLITFLRFNREKTEKKTGIVETKRLLTSEMLSSPPLDLSPDIYEAACLALATGKIQRVDLTPDCSAIAEPFSPKPRLIIFGGGHIGKPLVEYASQVGFHITVIDDRLSFANTARFPQADRVICESFEKSFHALHFRPSDFIVIITRGHRHDGTVLREILKHSFCYVGMIGSKRRVKGMMEELLEEGFSQDKLSTVHSPIGLDIGAVTPYEIAISIVAELISFKNKSLILPEFDREVIKKAHEISDIPKALITILSSKGSVPRKAGAKMIAYLDGSTLGSIGGGCSEAEVLTKGRSVMGSQNFLIARVDMTQEVAEAEGMVCGGVMEVLIEGISR